MAEDDGGWEDEDDMFPPVPDEGDEELQPEPEPEAPELAEATAALCSDAELATTLRVLEALQGEKEVFLRSRRFKKVRYFSRQLTTTLNEIMYDGLTEQEYQTKIIKTRIKSSIKDRMKRRDQDKVEKAKLRAARMSRLQQLQEQQGAGGMLALSAVPDGAVETGEPAVSAATLAAGVGAQSSFAVKAGRRTLTTGRETTGGAGAGGGGALEDGAPAAEGAGLVEDEADDADSAAQGGEGGEEQEDLIHERSCYLCKNWFKQLHHFYDQFCPQCAAVNWEKRHQTADMAGRVALVTGGRVKIGYHVALKLLRCGATTIVTSRFPADAARRFAAEADFGAWGERLHCYGLDLRHTQGVESFCAHISEKFSRLDVLINNACQTIRRPAAYYQHMIAGEKAAASEEEAAVLRPLLKDHLQWVGGGDGGLAQVEAPPADSPAGEEGGVALGRAGEGPAHDSAQLSQMAVHEEDSSVTVAPRAAQDDAALALSAEGAAGVSLPAGVYDVNGQQLDTRRENSWLLKLGEVATVEAAEVLAINTLAPFTLNSKLKPLMLAAEAEGEPKFVVNVSAMEGKFYRYKTPNHPHTNMAKAALNMMTRTSADALKDEGIYMNSVDTGWINDENPLEKASRLAAEGFQTPIDEIDAAARILDPAFVGYAGTLHHGAFFKDYALTEW